LATRTNPDNIPMTFVAIAGSTAAGSVTLVEHDMTTHLEITPWLAGLFVAPEMRGRGLGSARTSARSMSNQ